MNRFDIIVVGGGHAGCEAAAVAAQQGVNVLLISISLDKLAWMSCNPAIGGLAKGHLVKEIDVLGGIMGKAIDKTAIQSRVLNLKKGKAVQSTRMQADKFLYSREISKLLFSYKNLSFFQAEVSGLIINNNKIEGVNTCEGVSFISDIVILCPGTFLGGRLHYGDSTVNGGRSGEKSSEDLAQFLRNKTGHNISRFKTGTPARLDARTIDYSNLETQPHDASVKGFSFENIKNDLPKRSCYITRTNKNTHDIIRENILKAPLYSGKIQSKGPRYCPSIEDKVMRFPERDSHHIFLEPESLDCIEVYPNGVSTGLPVDIQIQMYRSINGLNDVRIIRPAYAVEYDYVNPNDLKLSLESKQIDGLFFAGQVNGTSGYEEAGAQGLVAGINAVKKIKGQDLIVFSRHESYIGVLIDDIVTKGVDEPYRLFSSRSEDRLFLREDNADIRLFEIAKQNSLISEDKYNAIKTKENNVLKAINILETTFIHPTNETNNLLISLGSTTIKKPVSAKELLRRTEISFHHIVYDIIKDNSFLLPLMPYSDAIEIEVKYEGYINMEKMRLLDFEHLEKTHLKTDFDYNKIETLSVEVRQKLNKIKPLNLGQASRIPGITPAAIDVLSIFKKKGVL